MLCYVIYYVMLGYFTSPRLGAVLEWAPGFRALGQPPSLASVTRDTYPPSATFGGRFIRRVARSLVSGLAHLHSRGLAHGDCYAHNVLVVDSGEAKLSDFGAAFYYGREHPHAAVYERMEARALGFLLQELLARHDGSEPAALGPVRALATACAATGNEAVTEAPEPSACVSFERAQQQLV